MTFEYVTGNGTLIGASANVAYAGLAEQNGYKISFNLFNFSSTDHFIILSLNIYSLFT